MRTTEGLISYIHKHRAVLLLLHLLCTYVPYAPTPPRMGRPSTKSVARIYPDVNSKLGPSWYEYGPSYPSFLSRVISFTPVQTIFKYNGARRITMRLLGRLDGGNTLRCASPPLFRNDLHR